MSEENVRYEVYSTQGKLLGAFVSQADAERVLGVWFNARCVIRVFPRGERLVVAEREELH